MVEEGGIRRYELQRTRQTELPHARVDWAAELNEQQLAAVRAPDGPVLVLAGAGSGKTRVITYRVAYLIAEQRLRPQNIMLATFTNKAARAMLGRVEQVVGRAARDVTGGTFHHIANLLLRRYAKALGYQNNFTILDEADARSVMRVCRGEAGVDTKARAFPSARLLTNIASAVVNTDTALEELLARRYPHLYELYEQIERVLIHYHERKQQSNQMDFDDLLVNMLRLLVEHPDIRASLASRYAHVLVDEYQDVNHLQAAIVRELFLGEQADDRRASADTARTARDAGDELQPPLPAAGAEKSGESKDEDSISSKRADAYTLARGLFVVGDDAQSIYSFRGADYENIRSFPRAFPGTAVYKLEINYRSVPQVLDLANGIMREADPQFLKTLTPVKPPGSDRPLLLACRDADEQAEFIAEQLLKLREEHGLTWREMAVLYRAHHNRLEVELELTQRGIPFMVRGGLRFFEQAHIKDLLSYAVVLANARDELAWQRMLEMCRRVGPKTVGKVLTKLRDATEEEGGPLGRFTRNGVADAQRGQAKQSLSELRDFLRAVSKDLEATPVPDLLQRILEERYHVFLEANYENWRERLDDLEQLIVFASRFDSLPAFLAEIGLHGGFSGADILAMDAAYDREEGAVTLSTIHQAKGLEWKVVFLIHAQDDVIPHRMSRGDPRSEDEERRLLYVAVTRAEELLYLSYPQLTQTRDFRRVLNSPSRFLADLPEDCYDEAVLEWDGE